MKVHPNTPENLMLMLFALGVELTESGYPLIALGQIADAITALDQKHPGLLDRCSSYPQKPGIKFRWK